MTEKWNETNMHYLWKSIDYMKGECQGLEEKRGRQKRIAEWSRNEIKVDLENEEKKIIGAQKNEEKRLI